MKKTLIFTALSAISLYGNAQSAFDVYNLTQYDLRGTARYMSMGGAFTALGGDLSTLNQNPAGIGVYRGSEVGITFDINAMSAAAAPGAKSSHTHFDVNNFGYVGTMQIGGTMPTLSWGFSYNRTQSFAREYRGQRMPLGTSLSNYWALTTDGFSKDDLLVDGKNNPYYSSDIPWSSVLAYNSGIITPVAIYEGDGSPYNIAEYNGLFQYRVLDKDTGKTLVFPTTGMAEFNVRERGYTDEYNVNVGGNISNVVYWGFGLGITDLKYEQNVRYSEQLHGANVLFPGGNNVEDVREGDCDFELSNWRRINGTGFNLKLGVILKPINEFRIGVALHTPTWYTMNDTYQTDCDFGDNYGIQLYNQTPVADYSWNLRTPWKLMFGAAGVVGGRFILSADYEYQATNKSHASDNYGDYDTFNQNIQDYFKATNIVRIGAELRVTPQFSVRAGYAFAASNVNNDVKNSDIEVFTSGCNPSYTLRENTNYVTCGVGYRTGGFYADLTYMHKQYNSTYHGFTSFTDYDGDWSDGPAAKITNKSDQIVLSLGYKF